MFLLESFLVKRLINSFFCCCLPPFYVVCQGPLQPSIVPSRLAISLHDAFELPIIDGRWKLNFIEKHQTVKPSRFNYIFSANLWIFYKKNGEKYELNTSCRWAWDNLENDCSTSLLFLSLFERAWETKIKKLFYL